MFYDNIPSTSASASLWGEKRKYGKVVKEMVFEKKSVNLLKELNIESIVNDNKDWRNYLRMDATTYNRLLELVTPCIKKDDACMRKSISPHERLSATLRFLAIGRSYKDLEFTTIVSEPSLSRTIPETYNTIYQVLKKN